MGLPCYEIKTDVFDMAHYDNICMYKAVACWSAKYKLPDQPYNKTARSKELKKLFEADIHDRANWQNMSHKQLEMIQVRDQNRRISVAKIFAEGCFKSADDYTEAALIYQHGDVLEHYYQAFIWSKNNAIISSSSHLLK